MGESKEIVRKEMLKCLDGEFRAVLLVPEAGTVEPEMAVRALRNRAVVPCQTHSLDVVVVDDSVAPVPQADAVVTFRSGMPVGVLTADCVPILLYAPDIRAVAAVHAGWRGTLGGIIDSTLDLLEEHGASPEKIQVVFGPSISEDDYEVSHELADTFKQAGFGDCVSWPVGEEGRPYIDLQGVNLQRLLRRGIQEVNITPSTASTFSSTDDTGQPLYPSHRRSGGSPLRLLTVIELI
ncbi:MAG: polyphenol oxidase family protein [Muribaculaceae bacterium]|nr:polyphenol oxidase family protein [Muribaculaceae bacterium]